MAKPLAFEASWAAYATMLADPELREDARHSVAEHKEIDDMLGALLDLAGC